MTIEEKAKAYDEALEGAIIAHKDEDRHLKATLERIFPELRESEDERIRKALIRFHKSSIDIDGIKGEDILAWLEKQNKQILANSAKTCKDEQKPSNLESIGENWSEGDEKMRTSCAACLGYHYHDGIMTRKEYEEASSWLKSLKERVQPKQELSKDNEVKINRIVGFIENLDIPDNDILRKDAAWLKSLKERMRGD